MQPQTDKHSRRPPVEALEKICRRDSDDSVIPSVRREIQGAVVYDYADADDFVTLWSLLNGAAALPAKLLIYWDGTAPDPAVSPVVAEPHVTPLSWAACAVARQPQTEVWILEGMRGDHRSFPGYREWAMLRPDFAQWVRLWQPVDGLPVPAGESSPEERQEQARSFLDRLAVGLATTMSQVDHHSVSNLIGPLLLLRDSKNLGSLHRLALLTILRAAKLVPVDPPRLRRPVVQAISCARLLVLDDQWQHGWARWVADTLELTWDDAAAAGTDGGLKKVASRDDVELWVEGTPERLLNRAQEIVRSGADARLAFDPLGVDEGGSPPILLLDLRLFASAPGREKSCLHALLDLIPWVQSVNKRPWAARIGQSELDAFRSWLDEGSAINEDQRITLLPRFLSELDFSLPIVLFSTTARRGVIELLKPYGNVITRFSKPKLTGTSPEDVVEAAELGLVAALQQACQLAEGRAFVQAVHTVGEETRKRTQALFGNGTWTYCELYIDESGSSPSKVGGYAVLYPDEKTGPSLLAEALKARNLVWGYSREGPSGFPSIYVTKASAKARELGYSGTLLQKEFQGRARNEAEAAKSNNCLAVGLMVSTNRHASEGLPGGPDLLYRSVATSLIEAFLYDWLPALEQVLGKTPGTLEAGLFVAVRQHGSDAETLIRHQWDFGTRLEKADHGDQEAGVKQVNSQPGSTSSSGENLGYVVTKEKGIVQVAPCQSDAADFYIRGRSLGNTDVYPMVVGITKQRGQGARVRRAVGVSMREYGSQLRQSPPQLPRQIHYASDDLLFRPDDVSDAFAAGFKIKWSVRLQTVLEASRALDGPESLPLGLQKLRESWNDDGLESLRRWVALRAVPLIDKMSGPEFLHFALPPVQRSTVRPASPVPTRVVNSPLESQPQHAAGSTPPTQAWPPPPPSPPSKELWLVEVGPFSDVTEAEGALQAFDRNTIRDPRTRHTKSKKYVAVGIVSGKEKAVRAATDLGSSAESVGRFRLR